MPELCDLAATDLYPKLRAKEISAAELVESSLARIEAVDSQTKAFFTVISPVMGLPRGRAGLPDGVKAGEVVVVA